MTLRPVLVRPRGRHVRVGLAVLMAGCSGAPDGTSVAMPGAGAGIGFDDLQYSPSLHRVLVPGGRSGTLDLVDPDTGAITTVGGFSSTPTYSGGHDYGVTSVAEGRGLLFATDRTTQTVNVIDPTSRLILSSAHVASTPDYVRYVQATSELWVSEPAALQIEVFAIASAAPFQLTSSTRIPVANGPESLVVDQTHGRAYTHRWQASSVVIDVTSRATLAEWPNGCAASRGLAVDEARHQLIAACSEGTVSVLDATSGKTVSTIAVGAGFDVIGYAPALHHVYAAGGACGCLVVFGVSRAGTLTLLGRFGADASTHCAVADDRGHAWVCDPAHGSLSRVDDPYAGTE